MREEDIRALGLFRQAYQKLREAIRDRAPLEWTYVTPEYHLYNEVAGQVARLISLEKAKVQESSQDAASALRRITDIRPEHWKGEVELRRSGKGT